MNVMLVAAPRDMVDSRVNTLEAAGLEPLVVDIEAFALIRALVEFNASDEYLHKTVALIDMGACHTDVNIVSQGEFALTRNIPIAGDSFTNAIKSLTGATFDESEKMKIDMANSCPIDQISSAQSDNQCWRAVQPLLDELVREIRRSIHYYQSQFPEGSADALVSKIILTGGSARMPGMSSYLESKLSIETKVADLFHDTAISSERIPEPFIQEHGPILAVGTGLALNEQTLEVKKKSSSLK